MRSEGTFVESPPLSWIGGQARRLGSLLLAVVLCATLCPTSSATTLTLQEAVARAFSQGVQARIARLETARAEKSLAATKGSYLPFIGATSRAGWSNRLDERIEVLDAQGRLRRYPFSALGSQEGWFNVFVKQLLLDLGKWRLVERAKLEAEIARIHEAQAREDIALEVLSRYVDVWKAERLLAAAAEVAEDADRLDRQAQHLLDVGRCLPTQRAAVGLYLDGARLETTRRQADVAGSREALVVTIGDAGWAADELLVDPASLPRVDEEIDGDRLLAAVEDGPVLRILDLRRRAEELRVAAARAEAYPKVGLVAGYSHYGVKRYDSYEDEVHAGIDLEIPLFDGFRTRYNVSKALDDLEIARLRHRSAVDAKRAEVHEALRRFTHARQAAALARRREELERERLRLADLSLRAQKGDLGLALAARANLAREKQAVIEVEHEAIRAWASLQYETGRLARLLIGDADGAGRNP